MSKHSGKRTRNLRMRVKRDKQKRSHVRARDDLRLGILEDKEIEINYN